MNAAEIVVREMQSDSGFQVRQLIAERISEPRKAPKLRPHGQVLPFYVAGRNVIFVRASVDYLGYNLRDPWWGVPRVGAIVLSVIPAQFHKVREVSLPRKNALNRAVEVPAIRGDLEAVFAQALLESGQELNRGFFGALPDLEVRHQFGLSIKGNEYPLVTKLGRITFAYSPLLLAAKRPNLIAFQVPGAQAVHHGFHLASSPLSGHDEQPHNRVAIEASEPLGAANRAAFNKALDRPHGCVGLRKNLVARQSFVRFTEGSFAGITAPALNAALAKVSELLASLVLASNAGHGASPLAFCG